MSLFPEMLAKDTLPDASTLWAHAQKPLDVRFDRPADTRKKARISAIQIIEVTFFVALLLGTIYMVAGFAALLLAL